MKSVPDIDPLIRNEESADRGFADSALFAEPVSVRSSINSYLTASLLSTYFSAFFFYIGYVPAAIIAFVVGWLAVPAMYLTDTVSFDGRVISRNGLLPTWWSRFSRTRRRLRLTDIDLVEATAIRSVRRGSSVVYRYRLTFRGRGTAITVVSGRGAFREFVQAVLSRCGDEVLDIRSTELREFLSEPKEILMKAEFARIPSSDLIESTYLSTTRRRSRTYVNRENAAEDETSEELLTLGNELRISGRLARGFETILRSVKMRPHFAAGVFDLGKCLYSISAAVKDRKLERRALAAIRLASYRGASDRELITRIGEYYTQIGQWERADALFQRIADELSGTFRSEKVRAEIALRKGKIAHVIHHYLTAERLATTAPQRRWAKGESDYFANLQSDEDYMQTEVARVSSLENSARAMSTTLRLALFALPLIVTGLIFDEPLVANVGWAVCTVSLTIWSTLSIVSRLLGRRIPYSIYVDERGE